MYYGLIAPFLHEFLHAYENYKRLRNKAPSLDTISSAEQYENILSFLEKKPSSVQYHIASMFYFSIKCERNAFISQMHFELKRLSQSINFNLKSTSEIVKHLSLYNEFKRFDDDIFYFKNEASYFEKKEIITTVEILTNKKWE